MNTTDSRHTRSKSFEAKAPAGKPNWLKTIFRSGKSPFVKGKPEKGATTFSDGPKRSHKDDSCFLYTPSNADATELRISLDEKFNHDKKPLDVVTTNPGKQMFSPFPFSESSPTSDQHRLRSPRDDFSYMEQATKVIHEKDARIGRLERAKRDIQWKFDLMSVEYSAFKKKTAKDLQDKDNSMDLEKMNLVETCLDLVTENDALKKVAMLDGTKKPKSVADPNVGKKELNDSFLAAKSVFEVCMDDATGTNDDFTDKWLIDLVNQGNGDFAASEDQEAQLDLLDVANGSSVKESLFSCLFPMLSSSR